MISIIPDVNEIIFFYKDAASQFKSQYFIQHLTTMMVTNNVELSWNYFALFHGNGDHGWCTLLIRPTVRRYVSSKERGAYSWLGVTRSLRCDKSGVRVCIFCSLLCSLIHLIIRKIKQTDCYSDSHSTNLIHHSKAHFVLLRDYDQ